MLTRSRARRLPVAADLLMIVPSRGRPQNVVDLIDEWTKVTGDNAELLFALDKDDPTLEQYKRVLAPAFEVELPVDVVVGTRRRLGGTLNKVAVERAGRYRAVGFMGDDHRPRTEGWDERFVAALDELGTGLAYGNDLIQGAALPTAVAMTSDIVQTLGWMVPPGLVHLWIDNAWLELGRRIDRIRYLPDVVIEHMHPLVGKAPSDAGYQEVNSSAQFESDRRAFEDWVRDGLDADVAKLKELIRR